MQKAKPKYLAWSHSRISDFKKCRAMFWWKNVDPRKPKPVAYIETPSMKEGKVQHKAFEDRIATGKPFPERYAHYEPIAQAILNAPGENMCEHQITFDPAFKQVGWFDKNAYLRVGIDILKLHGSVAWAGDYKSGNPWTDESNSQLKLTAAIVFTAFPEVQKVTTSYIWLKPGLIESSVYHRSQFQELWQELMVEPNKMQEAYVLDHWPTNPTNWNCGYCPVNAKGLCTDAKGSYKGS